MSKAEAALKRKQLLKSKRSDAANEFNSLDDILPSTTPRTTATQKRDIMKPQIQNICGDCHSTCSTCASSNAETDCWTCQQGLAFIAHDTSAPPVQNATRTGVCVSPVAQANQSVIHQFNANLIWMSLGALAILSLFVAVIVALIRVPNKSKLRDTYTYDRVDDAALLSEYEEDVLDDAFLSYKELKSKFKDQPTDDEDDVDRMPRDNATRDHPKDLPHAV